MPRYHGIDWDAVERRLAEMEWLRSVYAKDPNFELIGFEFIDGWPHEKLRARPTAANGPRERFTANEYVMALRTDYAAPGAAMIFSIPVDQVGECESRVFRIPDEERALDAFIAGAASMDGARRRSPGSM